MTETYDRDADRERLIVPRGSASAVIDGRQKEAEALRSRASLLDSVKEQAGALQRQVGTADRRRLEMRGQQQRTRSRMLFNERSAGLARQIGIGVRLRRH